MYTVYWKSHNLEVFISVREVGSGLGSALGRAGAGVGRGGGGILVALDSTSYVLALLPGQQC